MMVSDECKMVTDHGFVKQRCQFRSLDFVVYKCANSKEYYAVLITSWSANDFLLISKSCPKDPRNYQSCGLVTKNKIVNSEFNCNAVICLYKSLERMPYSNDVAQECFDLLDGKVPMVCNPSLDTQICSKILFDETQDTDNHNTKCDMFCHNPRTCIDEAVCNGLLYGMFCKKNGVSHYIKTFHICDQHAHCDDKSDEQNCHVSHSGSVCVPYNHDFEDGHGVPVPLRNNTRCGPLQIRNHGHKRALCNNFQDQLNCTDSQRGVLTCDVRGYPSTVSLAVICLDLEGVTLCDDGLEGRCKQTSQSCLVHKHLLCNGVEDCEDGSDERDMQCNDMLTFKCYRK